MVCDFGKGDIHGFRPLSGSYISQLLNRGIKMAVLKNSFRPLSGSYISQLCQTKLLKLQSQGFRPLSGSYISQYHPRNPMSCLGRIGGLRGKSNFIEIQPFWKVKSSHKSSI